MARALLLAAVLVLWGQPSRATLTPAGPYAAGDQAFRERAKESSARQALAFYRARFITHPEDAEAGWRLSMACYCVGFRLTKEGTEDQLALFREGRDAGLSALKISPGCAACHFWTGTNMALYGQGVGVFKMLFTLGDSRKHFEETARIDPGYASSGSLRVLGVIEEKVPGILGGSNQRAREHYERAVVESPDEPLNRLFLARLLASKFSDREGALRVAKAGIALAKPSADRVESVEARAELEAEIQRWTDELARNPP